MEHRPLSIEGARDKDSVKTSPDDAGPPRVEHRGNGERRQLQSQRQQRPEDPMLLLIGS